MSTPRKRLSKPGRASKPVRHVVDGRAVHPCNSDPTCLHDDETGEIVSGPGVRPNPTKRAAERLEVAHLAVGDAALETVAMIRNGADPRTAFQILSEAVDEWKRAGQALHDSQLSSARAS